MSERGSKVGAKKGTFFVNLPVTEKNLIIMITTKPILLSWGAVCSTRVRDLCTVPVHIVR